MPMELRRGRISLRRLQNFSLSAGYDGTSFRDITEASGIGLGSLVYHFGVKHNLYLETLNAFLMSKERALEIVAPLNACRKKDRKSVVNALVTAIASYLREIHCNRKFPFLPAFYTRLLIDAGKDAGKIVDARLTQARDSLNQFAMRLNPETYGGAGLCLAQARHCTDSIYHGFQKGYSSGISYQGILSGSA